MAISQPATSLCCWHAQRMRHPDAMPHLADVAIKHHQQAPATVMLLTCLALPLQVATSSTQATTPVASLPGLPSGMQVGAPSSTAPLMRHTAKHLRHMHLASCTHACTPYILRDHSPSVSHSVAHHSWVVRPRMAASDAALIAATCVPCPSACTMCQPSPRLVCPQYSHSSAVVCTACVPTPLPVPHVARCCSCRGARPG